ncbi:hypothetical protein NM22_18485 [Vibrio tubiashii]|nr:hypothetical protein NM22_18485 [Vibrio tubiashii]
MNKKTVFTKAFLKSLDSHLADMKAKQMEWRDASQQGLSVILYPTGRKSFFFTYTHRKRRYRERLGDTETLTLTQAREMTLYLRCAIQMGDNPLVQRKKGEVLFEKVVHDYLVHTKPIKKSHKDDESKCRLHILPYFGKKQLNAITTTTLETYHAKIAQKLTPATSNRHLALLKAIFTFAIKKKLITASPAKGITPFSEETKEIKYIPNNDLELFLSALEKEGNVEAAAILLFMLLTGLRSGSARSARLENYDQHTGTLLIPMMKGGKGQRLTLSDKAKNIVETQIQKHGTHGFIFRGIDMISRISDPRNVMKRVCKKAGIEAYSPHSLRHQFAKTAVEQGASMIQLNKVLNHQSITTTNIYAALCNDKQKKVNDQVANALI